MLWISLLAAFCHQACGQTPSAATRPTTHLVSCIDVKNFGAETLRIGDLNGDGAPDLLFIQSIRDTREITCLTAASIMGDVYWQTGSPDAGNGRIYSDLPVQVYDWDADGWNDVLYVRQAKYAAPPFQGGARERADRYEGEATLLVLDGRNGQEKCSMKLPAPADDCFLLADLEGRGRREDLVVKDRYWNVWGVSHAGKELWHWSGSPGHFPSVADVDGDGKDEVFVGFALLDENGKELFSRDAQGAHQDACYLLRPSDGRWRLLFGNGGIHCLGVDGTEMWHHPLGEAQHVIAGRYRADSEVQLAVVDRTPVPTHRRDRNAWANLHMYDLNGREIWRRQQEPGAWAIAILTANWMGGGQPQSVFAYGQGEGRPAVMCDGEGQVIDSFPLVFKPQVAEKDQAGDVYGFVADVWGDSRDEVILFHAHGACIYANARLCPIPTLYNETLYPGM
jgi:hypothetical protein